MLRHPLLKVCSDDPPEVQAAKLRLRMELQSIESCQFLLCEWGKIVTFLANGNITYRRNYWSIAELQSPDTWAESDEEE